MFRVGLDGLLVLWNVCFKKISLPGAECVDCSDRNAFEREADFLIFWGGDSYDSAGDVLCPCWG